MSPVITIATCFILIVVWYSPVDVYAGEIQGVVDIDGEIRFLTLRENNPTIAWWSAKLTPNDRIINRGAVAVMNQSGEILISNTPFIIYCNRIYFPIVER